MSTHPASTSVLGTRPSVNLDWLKQVRSFERKTLKLALCLNQISVIFPLYSVAKFSPLLVFVASTSGVTVSTLTGFVWAGIATVVVVILVAVLVVKTKLRNAATSDIESSTALRS